jgi:hypothetical protein
MSNHNIARALLLAAAPALGACVGSDSIAFATIDNFGVVVESTPYPYVDIGFGRTEGVVQPAFESGGVSGVLAAGAHNVTAIAPFSSEHSSLFAGGAVAARLAQGGSQPTTSEKDDRRDGSRGATCVSGRPTGWDGRQLPEGPVSRPLVFATSTSIGFRVALPPQNAALPVPVPNVNLGYRRAEFAVAPLFGQPGGCNEPLDGRPDERLTYQINSPSFVARLQTGQGAGTAVQGGLTGGNFNVGQVFGTGAAASRLADGLAVNPDVRRLLHDGRQGGGGQ